MNFHYPSDIGLSLCSSDKKTLKTPTHHFSKILSNRHLSVSTALPLVDAPHDQHRLRGAQPAGAPPPALAAAGQLGHLRVQRHVRLRGLRRRGLPEALREPVKAVQESEVNYYIEKIVRFFFNGIVFLFFSRFLCGYQFILVNSRWLNVAVVCSIIMKDELKLSLLRVQWQVQLRFNSHTKRFRKVGKLFYGTLDSIFFIWHVFFPCLYYTYSIFICRY